MHNYKIKNKYAFTLIEILIAMSIAGLILSAVYGGYRATTLSISHCKPKSILEQQARLFLFRLTSELRCCYAGSSDQPDRNLLQNTTGKEVHNSISQQESHKMFSGEKVSAGKIFLQFVTTSFAQSSYQNMGGLAIVSYKLDDSGKVLLRNVRKYTEIDEDDDKDYQWFPVLSNIKTLSCEFLKEKKWQKDWQLKDIRILPESVRISLVLQDDEAGSVSFASCAYIMCSESKLTGATIETNSTTSNF
jgi:type II secretion system protein J